MQRLGRFCTVQHGVHKGGASERAPREGARERGRGSGDTQQLTMTASYGRQARRPHRVLQVQYLALDLTEGTLGTRSTCPHGVYVSCSLAMATPDIHRDKCGTESPPTVSMVHNGSLNQSGEPARDPRSQAGKQRARQRRRQDGLDGATVGRCHDGAWFRRGQRQDGRRTTDGHE